MGQFLEPFSISRDLLQGIASECPDDSLSHTMDLLGASEFVISVYERIEGGPLGSSSSFIESTNISSHDGLSLARKPFGSSIDDLAVPTLSLGTERKSEVNFSTDDHTAFSESQKKISETVIFAPQEAETNNEIKILAIMNSIGNLKISETNYVKDGILMPRNSVIGSLLKYAFKELQQRRCRTSKLSMIRSQGTRCTVPLLVVFIHTF